MPAFRSSFSGLRLVIVLWLVSSLPSAAELKVGLAHVDITPPIGYRMAGYFSERLSTNIHDPLHAKVIFLKQDREEAALVFCDLVDISLNVSTNTRSRASINAGIPAANILIAGTHSHTGPLYDTVRRDLLHAEAVAKHGHDPHEAIDYPAFLIERISHAIAEAKRSAKSAQIDIGSARQQGLSFNRRFHMKNGTVAFNPGRLNPNIVRPAGPIDPEVGVLLVRHDTKPSAILTVFAMHLDTVGGLQYSADFPYFLERELKRDFGGNLLSVFGAGTCGDINHIDVSQETANKGLAETERIGVTLAGTVRDAVPALRRIQKPALAVRTATPVIPLQPFSPEQLARAREIANTAAPFLQLVEATKVLDLARRGDSVRMEVQVFRLDAATAVVGLPGEIFVELGLAIKEASPFKNTFVLSICNDRPAYVPTKKAFAEGSYEVVNSRVVPGGGEILVETAVKLLKELALE